MFLALPCCSPRSCHIPASCSVCVCVYLRLTPHVAGSSLVSVLPSVGVLCFIFLGVLGTYCSFVLLIERKTFDLTRLVSGVFCIWILLEPFRNRMIQPGWIKQSSTDTCFRRKVPCSVVASRHIRLRSQAFRRGSQEVLGFFATVPARVLSASTHVLFGCREDKICKWTFAWKGISLGASVQRAHTSEQTEVRSICEWSRWFERIFDRPNHSGSASDRLFMIQRGSHSVAEYAIEFGTLAEEAAWNETALLNVFCGGLSGSVCWGAAAKGFGGTNWPRYRDR